jgi:hypothetical protein
MSDSLLRKGYEEFVEWINASPTWVKWGVSIVSLLGLPVSFFLSRPFFILLLLARL